MLKITTQDSPPTLVLEGRLAGPWVNEAGDAWRRLREASASVIVEFTAVTFVDDAGKALLARMWREGADLRATGCCNRFIAEQITGGCRPT
jgi:ABC-type transporter Mla MlaB component